MRATLAAAVLVVLTVAGCVPAPPASPTPLAASPTRTAASATPGARGATPRLGVRPAPMPRPIPTYGPAQAAVASLDDVFDGVLPAPSSDYGMVVEDLTSGARAAVNENQVFPSASLYKLGVAWMVLRQVDAGALRLHAPLVIEDDDAVEAEPEGGIAAGDTPTVQEALASMLTISSNAAAHAFLRTSGRAAFNQEMQRIGLRQTRVPEDVPAARADVSDASDGPARADGSDTSDGSAASGGPEASDGSAALERAELAVTSAADVAHLLRLLAASQELSPTSRAILAECMATANPPDALRDTLPDDIDVLDKTGNLDDASNVAALLQSSRGTVILVVLDQGVDPGDARGVIGQAGQVAYSALLQNSPEARR